MHSILSEYLAFHGYWVLFLWTFMEGEAGLILAGFLAFQGYFSLPAVMVTAFGGAFVGDQFYFYLGRLKGKYLMGYSHSLARKFRKGLRLIERNGTFIAFSSRYTYGFRIVLPIILGMTSFKAMRFLWLNILSATGWAIIFSIAGYMFGESASFFLGDVKKYEQYLLALLASIIACIWIGHFAHARWRRYPARARLKRMKRKGMFEYRGEDSDV